MSRRRVLVVEEKRLLADVLCQLLSDEDDLQVVGTADHAGAAVASAQRFDPDVVLVSERVGTISGQALCRVLRRLLPASVLLLWSDTELPSAVRTGPAGGPVDAVLDRSLSFRELVRALHCCTVLPSPPAQLHLVVPRVEDERPPAIPAPAEEMLLRCPGCDVEVSVQVRDMTATVSEVRAFFLAHDGCATTIDLAGPTRSEPRSR